MKLKIIKICIFVLLFTLITFFLSCASQSKPRVALLKSDATLAVFGITGKQEHEEAKSTLNQLSVNYEEILDDQLEKDDLDYDLIILPNTRCLSKKSADNLREFLKSGGKILAFYQTGYRDQNNKLIGKTNNFHASDIMGADFYIWTNNPPSCEFIKSESSFFKEKFSQIQLARNTAMLIKPHPDSEILAKFVDSDGVKYSAPDKLSAAIIINKDKNCIYCGENLLISANSASLEVKKLIIDLINYLSPGVAELDLKKAAESKKDYLLPYKANVNISPSKQFLKIRVADNLENAAVSSNSRLKVFFKTIRGWGYIKRMRGEILYIKPVYNGGLIIYSKDKKILKKAYYPLKIFSISGEPVNLIKINKNGTYKLQGFRGSVLISQRKNKLRVINYLTIEEYLAGVVPNEMPQHFPKEALKAMAVVSRTFALSNLKRHSYEGFDLCSTVHCQVYEGVLSEQDSTSQAVNETSGEVLVYKGKLANTPFYACCGGLTEDVENAWSKFKRVGYLSSVSNIVSGEKPDLSSEENFKKFIDNPPLCYCSESGRFRWKDIFELKQVEEFLKDSLPYYFGTDDINLGKLRDLKVIKRTKSGRVSLLEIKTTIGYFYIKGDAVRWIFTGGRTTTGGLQSTLFYIDKVTDNRAEKIVFIGGGWGHGVGLCQEGAGGLAKAGFNYKDIIKHYYTGVEIVIRDW